MYKNRVFDREAGFDTLIVVQVFGIVLLILTNWFLDLLVNYTELIFSEISKM